MTLTQILQKIKSAFYNKSETDALLSSKSDTSHNHNSVYLGISAKAESSKSADSVAWNNVSGKPSSYTPSSHTHDDRYYTESEIDTKLSGKSNSDHNHNSTYLGISAKAESSKVADYAKLLAYSHTDEINFKGGRQATCFFNYRNADDDSTGTAATVEYKFCNYGGNSVSNVTVSAGTFKENGSNLADKYQAKGSYASSNHSHSNYLTGITKTMVTDALGYTPPTTNTTYSKLSQFTNDSGYITGINKTMVVNALGYTPPTSDTNTTYSAGTNMSLSGTTFATSSTPSFSNVTVTNNSSNGLLFGSYRVYVG